MATPTIQLGTRVTAQTHAALATLARKRGTSITREVNQALQDYLRAANRKGDR